MVHRLALQQPAATTKFLNEKVMEGKLLKRHRPENFGLVQLGDHFEGNMQLHL
jgi:hypothetical protein